MAHGKLVKLVLWVHVGPWAVLVVHDARDPGYGTPPSAHGVPVVWALPCQMYRTLKLLTSVPSLVAPRPRTPSILSDQRESLRASHQSALFRRQRWSSGPRIRHRLMRPCPGGRGHRGHACHMPDHICSGGRCRRGAQQICRRTRNPPTYAAAPCPIGPRTALTPVQGR